MNTLKRSIFTILVSAALSILAQAQSPKAIVVQAASASVPTPASATVAVPDNSASLQEAIKSLQEIRATNSEILRKQQAALEQLDDLQKAAAQIKIFAHRTGG
jgi:predicted transcriptional regulator